MKPADARRLLRWYPPRWRARYGDELLATIEQQLGGARPSLRLRLSLARAGTTQRLRDGGLAGRSADGPARIRAGALAVLWGWTLFVLAGLALAKTAEHWQAATPRGSRELPAIALGVTQALAALAALLVAAAALAVAAPLRDFLRDGGWRQVRRSVAWALVASALAACALAALVVWAHRLPASRRDGSDVAYALAALAAGALVAASAFAWAAVATRTLRRLTLGAAVLRLHALLACAVAASLALMTIATGAWWAAVASSAPWFLDGGAPGTAGWPWDPTLIASLGAMVSATALGALGARRALAASS